MASKKDPEIHNKKFWAMYLVGIILNLSVGGVYIWAIWKVSHQRVVYVDISQIPMMCTCLMLFDSLRRFLSLKEYEVFISKKIFLLHCFSFLIFLLTSIFQILVLQNANPTVRIDAITNLIFQSMLFIDQLYQSR